MESGAPKGFKGAFFKRTEQCIFAKESRSCPADMPLSYTVFFTSWSPRSICSPYSRTFTEVGVFSYHDPINPLLVGQIQVEAPPPVNQPPALVITSPAPGSLVGAQMQVEGTVSDDGPIPSVTVNGRSVPVQAGTFNTRLTLAGKGNQNIVAGVLDSQGLAASATVVVIVDGEGPRITVDAPKDRQSVTTRRPEIFATFADFYSPVNPGSVSVILQDDQGAVTNITPDLGVTAAGVSGRPAADLATGRSYTLRVADQPGNMAIATTTFFVPDSPAERVAQCTPGEGWRQHQRERQPVQPVLRNRRR